MNFQDWFDGFGSAQVSVLIGLLIGVVFGIFAQQSRFCLRAACVEFWRGRIGPKFAIWLLTFGAALLGVQLFIEAGLVDTGLIRPLNNVGSMSGAIVGGLMFGSGMVLAGGCASRLLVLSATGNVRTLVAGLVVTLVAQASLRGVLSLVAGRRQFARLLALDAAVWRHDSRRPDFVARILARAAKPGQPLVECRGRRHRPERCPGVAVDQPARRFLLRCRAGAKHQFYRTFGGYPDGSDQSTQANIELRYRTGSRCFPGRSCCGVAYP
jgi:uncharacterized membrane protein YedE/YeeE